jgi:hypothetical protein
MTVNLSIWLRAFRLPLQRAYPRLDDAAVEDIEVDLTDLLRAADERMAERDAPEYDNKDTCRQH